MPTGTRVYNRNPDHVRPEKVMFFGRYVGADWKVIESSVFSQSNEILPTYSRRAEPHVCYVASSLGRVEGRGGKSRRRSAA